MYAQAYFYFISFSTFLHRSKNRSIHQIIRCTWSANQGDAVLKGFENWLSASSINSSGKNNNQLNFTVNVTAASADLKRAMSNGELLLSGQVTVLSANPSGGRPLTSYTIKMENIAVVSCYEAMGCNNAMNTTLTLQVARIGWTYYNTTTQAVSRKFGWDVEKNMEWSSF